MTADSQAQPAASTAGVPLFVDLDGTLIRSDLLLESAFLLARSSPAALLLMPWWLLHGKARLKSEIAARVDIDPRTLPYEGAFLAFLRSEAARGRPLYLTTASNEKYALAVARHLAIFSGAFGSTRDTNLKGERKLEQIRTLSADRGFDYAGNDFADLEVWKHARQAILVNPAPGLPAAAGKVARVGATFDDRSGRLLAGFQALRVHQWLKNLIIFVPILTGHAWSAGTVASALLAFVAFSLVASATYVLNDLLDLQSDRNHPRKRARAFAAGAIPLSHGFVLALCPLAAGLGLSLLLPPLFQATVAGYLAMTLLYSFRLKSYVLIDVVTLASLYTLRLIAGGAAVGIALSFWLLAFSVFVFFSLALIKRCSELNAMIQAGGGGASGRDYQASDLSYLTAMGTASGYVSILVLALFINSPDIAARYSEPRLLWLLCPLLLYWISRLWIKTGRGEMHDDPIVFTVKDRGSRYVVAAAIVIVLLAMQVTL